MIVFHLSDEMGSEENRVRIEQVLDLREVPEDEDVRIEVEKLGHTTFLQQVLEEIGFRGTVELGDVVLETKPPQVRNSQCRQLDDIERLSLRREIPVDLVSE